MVQRLGLLQANKLGLDGTCCLRKLSTSLFVFFCHNIQTTSLHILEDLCFGQAPSGKHPLMVLGLRSHRCSQMPLLQNTSKHIVDQHLLRFTPLQEEIPFKSV